MTIKAFSVCIGERSADSFTIVPRPFDEAKELKGSPTQYPSIKPDSSDETINCGGTTKMLISSLGLIPVG